jgi:hypothetical protein
MCSIEKSLPASIMKRFAVTGAAAAAAEADEAADPELCAEIRIEYRTPKIRIMISRTPKYFITQEKIEINNVLKMTPLMACLGFCLESRLG